MSCFGAEGPGRHRAWDVFTVQDIGGKRERIIRTRIVGGAAMRQLLGFPSEEDGRVADEGIATRTLAFPPQTRKYLWTRVPGGVPA